MPALDSSVERRIFNLRSLQSEQSPRIAALPADRAKRVFDILVAAGLLVVAAPVICLLAILTRATSPGPAIYRQRRVGRAGRCFVIYKIRTMAFDCERESGVMWSTPGDPRITGFGRLLRDSHLDELPQLWNILKGDMSLIGPRPERPEFVAEFTATIPRYRERLAVRPGLTGLAQVSRPPDLDEEDVSRKLAIDLHYIQHRSFGLDFRILLCTWAFLLGVPFCSSRRAMRLPAFEVDDQPRSTTPWEDFATTADGA